MELDTSTTQSGASVVHEVMKDLYKPVPFSLEQNKDLLVVPAGMTVIDLQAFTDKRATRPARQTGTISTNTVGDLIDVSKRFALAEESTCYMDVEATGAGKIMTVLNHARGGAAPAPGHGDFKVLHTLKVSPILKAWTDVSVRWLSQKEFATFVEQRILDLIAVDANSSLHQFAGMLQAKFASPAEMYTATKGIDIRVNQEFKQAVNLDTGAVALSFVETHEKGASTIEVPRLFAIRSPVWEGGTEYEIPVRVRYEIQGDDKKIKWRLEPQILDRVVTHAVEHMHAKLVDGMSPDIAVVQGWVAR